MEHHHSHSNEVPTGWVHDDLQRDYNSDPEDCTCCLESLVELTRKYVESMLDEDAHRRRLQDWPLIGLEDVTMLGTALSFYSERGETWSTPKDTNTFLRSYKADVLYYEALEILEEDYPHAQEILKLGANYLVMAGDVVASLIVSEMTLQNMDGHFFFHGLISYEAEAIVQKISTWWVAKNTEDYKFEVYRNSNVTILTQSVVGMWVKPKPSYQLHHSVFKNPSAVIGQFDMSPASVLFDGKNFLTTELGAFSLVSRMFIPDISRRSSLFDLRIEHYISAGYNPVFIVDEMVAHSKVKQDPKLSRLTVRLGGDLMMNATDPKGFLYPSILFDQVFKYTPSRGLRTDFGNHFKYTPSRGLRTDFGNHFKYTPSRGLRTDFGNVEIQNTISVALGKFDEVFYSGCKDDFQLPIMTDLELYHYWERIKSNHVGFDVRITFLPPWFEPTSPYQVHFHGDIKGDRMWHSVVDSCVDDIRKRVKENYSALRRRNIRNVEWVGMSANQMDRITGCVETVDTSTGWYNLDIVKPLHIGIPFDVCCTLLKGWKTPGCILNKLNKDVFYYLMRTIRASLVTSPILKLIRDLNRYLNNK